MVEGGCRNFRKEGPEEGWGQGKASVSICVLNRRSFQRFSYKICFTKLPADGRYPCTSTVHSCKFLLYTFSAVTKQNKIP